MDGLIFFQISNILFRFLKLFKEVSENIFWHKINQEIFSFFCIFSGNFVYSNIVCIFYFFESSDGRIGCIFVGFRIYPRWTYWAHICGFRIYPRWTYWAHICGFRIYPRWTYWAHIEPIGIRGEKKGLGLNSSVFCMNLCAVYEPLRCLGFGFVFWSP